jgi:hypothetical protein
MKNAQSAGAILVLALGACSATPDHPIIKARVELPLYVGNGAGSEHGNYAARADGEFRDDDGARCVAFNWDRPLTDQLAIRYRSASCESKERPGFMVCHEISRTVIPIAESNLEEEE